MTVHWLPMYYLRVKYSSDLGPMQFILGFFSIRTDLQITTTFLTSHRWVTFDKAFDKAVKMNDVIKTSIYLESVSYSRVILPSVRVILPSVRVILPSVSY